MHGACSLRVITRLRRWVAEGLCPRARQPIVRTLWQRTKASYAPPDKPDPQPRRLKRM